MSRQTVEGKAQSKAGDPITLEAALSAGKKVPPDVTGLLMEDHRVVLGWFYWHQAITGPQTKAELVTKICDALDAHMVAEEEILYPAAEEELGDPDLVEHAFEEHRGAQELMEKLRAGGGSETERDELMRELEAEISQHVAEEESELFPALRDSELDLYELGAAVAARRVDRLFELRGNPEARLAKKEARPAKKKAASSSKLKRATKKG